VAPISVARVLAAIALSSVLGAPAVEAQLVPVQEPHRFEFTPFAGYQFGGSFDTDAGGSVPAGTIELKDQFGWGAIVGFATSPQSAVELTYLREDTDITFNPATGTRPPGQCAESASATQCGFAVNYLQIGGRYDFIPAPQKFIPFIDLSLGIGIFDPKADGIGSETRFSWTVGGGARYMFGQAQKVGLRFDGRLWVTPVPSGDYGVWCDFYGCFTAEGTAWVTQGTVSGGLMFLF
jgi:opacity protein-like surface antigen